jgi:hypothetical protein
VSRAGGKGGTSGMVTEMFRRDNLESGVVGGTCVLSVVAHGTDELCRHVTLLKATKSVCTTCELFYPKLGLCLPTVRRLQLRKYLANSSDNIPAKIILKNVISDLFDCHPKRSNTTSAYVSDK